MGLLIKAGMFGARRERVSEDGTVLVVVGTDDQGHQIWGRVPVETGDQWDARQWRPVRRA